MNLLFFLLLIGPLIFVHELGHFIAARFFGVGVTRFAIGFGPKILGFTRGETEYVIGAFPLGGYVRLVGADPLETQELDSADRPKALLSKPVWQRMIVLLAGPLANLLLPLPIFILYYMADDYRLPARVGTVIEDSPADLAGLEAGDLILSVDGNQVRHFDQLQSLIGEARNREAEIRILRGDEEHTLMIRPELVRSRDPWVQLRAIERPVIGVDASSFGPIIHIQDPEGLAARAGLQTFDRVRRVGEHEIHTFADLRIALGSSQGEVVLLVMRPEPLASAFGDLFIEWPLTIRLDLGEAPDLESLALDSAAMVIYSVAPGSPADEAGFLRGDEIVSVDGRGFNVFSSMMMRLHQQPDVPHEVVYRRQGELRTAQLVPVKMAVTGDFKQSIEETFIGFRSLASASYYPAARQHYPPLEMSLSERFSYGFSMGFQALFGFIIGIVVGVWQIITGTVGLDSLGGPIMIFDIAGRAGQAGVGVFMKMMGLISINLGIINLLPIPVLDGGHLLLFSIEGVTRRPLTTRTRQIVTYIGLVFIIFLFLLVFKNDIERYWQDFVEFFG